MDGLCCCCDAFVGICWFGICWLLVRAGLVNGHAAELHNRPPQSRTPTRYQADAPELYVADFASVLGAGTGAAGGGGNNLFSQIQSNLLQQVLGGPGLNEGHTTQLRQVQW